MIRLKIGDKRLNAEHIFEVNAYSDNNAAYVHLLGGCDMPIEHDLHGDEATAFLWWWDKFRFEEYRLRNGAGARGNCINVMEEYRYAHRPTRGMGDQ